MLIPKLKSLPLVALAATLFLLPAPRAEAWQYVCLENRGAYLASLIVVYGFGWRHNDNTLPNWANYWWLDHIGGPAASRRWGKGHLTHRFPDMTHPAKVSAFVDDDARGLVRTDRAGFPVLQSRCVEISALAEGHRFYVIATTEDTYYSPSNWTVCDTHESNPRPYYTQQHRPYNEIWFTAHGVAWDPWCVYSKEIRPR